jgi:hypothetical protein
MAQATQCDRPNEAPVSVPVWQRTCRELANRSFGYSGVVIARAVLCPSPPLLARELTGRAVVLPELRDACAAAVARLVKADAEVVAVVGSGETTATWDPAARLDLSAYAPPPSPVRGTPGLPLALGLGALLLDNAGYTGPRLLQAVGESEPARLCLRLGASLASAALRVGLLVVGDGSARRGPSAPGHFDERAAPFDAEVARAISAGDMAALAALDPALARELMATGRPAWQVLAGAFGAAPEAAPPSAEILYAGDPFGVAYLVAIMEPA